jgi:uncharacterized repeat protein (TIGR01451 family)
MNNIRKSFKLAQFFFIIFCATFLFSCNQATPDIAVDTDLELSISAITPTVQIGQNLEFALIVKNIGANDASNVTVLNPIPQNASFISVSSSQGTCTQKDGTISCVLGKLAVTKSATVNLILTSNTVGTIKNTASVVATEVDVTTTNNIASSSVTLQALPPQANLQLAGTVAPNPVQIGQNLTYTFNITNIGPDTATSIQFTDVLSSNITYVSSTTSQGTCTYASGNLTLTCNLDSLTLNGTAQVKLVATPKATGTLTQTPTLRAAEVDPNTANNTTTITASVQPAPPVPTADLGLTMSATPNPVQTGQNLTYAIKLTNTGPDAASNTKIINPLPQNTTYVSSNTSQGSCAATTLTLTCNLGSLAANASANVNLVVTSKVAGTITNSADATATESDPDTSNNSASADATVQVPATADLKVTIAAAPNPVQTGQNINYTFKVSNLGGNNATAVNLSDALPANTTFVSHSTSQGSCSAAGGTFSCALGSLNLTAVATVTLVLTSNTVGTLSNTVNVSATQTDPNTTNNSASTSVSVQAPPAPSANLGLTLSAAPNPVQTGQNLTYTFNVGNAGPNDATNVKISDPIPQNATFVSSSNAQGTCASNAGIFSCSLGTIAANASVQVSMVVTSSVAGTLTNSASVSATEIDPATGNNSASASVNVQAPAVPTANLGLTNSATPNPLDISTNATLTYTVSNAGPDSASSSTFTTNLPTNASYVSSNPSQGTCSFSAALLTCNLGNIAPNGSAQVSLVLTSSVLGILNTSANVSATELDPVASNNSSSLNITVQNPPTPGTINLPPTGKIGWDWQIGASGDSNVTIPAGVTLLDLDGFNISANKITSLKAQGIYTVCYIDTGSYEDGRPDSSLYPAYLKIFKDTQWNEWFLDVSDVFRPIQPAGTQLINNQWVDASGKPLTGLPTAGAFALLLEARFKMCADKGFDALEPDNLQNDENAGGKVSLQQQLDFNGWVADTAHAYGLAAFQKNGPDKVLGKDKTGKMMVEKFDGILNEECQQFGECGPLAEYVKRGKLALNTEYAGSLDCTLSNSLVINSIMKDLNLTGGNMSGYKRQSCN